MSLKKEKLKFDKEFESMLDKHNRFYSENRKVMSKDLSEYNSLKKKFDSKWDSIRKIKQ